MPSTAITALLTIALFLWSPFAQAFDYTIQGMNAGISRHKATWIMPVTWAEEYAGENTEVVFQLSVKKQLLDTGFHVAYTHKSFWQAYNRKESSPFRETNYNPEIFYRLMPGSPLLQRAFGDGPVISRLGADIGFEHQSNGRTMPESRSWNRIYLTPFYVQGNLLLWLKAWYITPDSEKNPDDERGSNNPDISEFLGYSAFNIKYQYNRAQLIHLIAGGNTATGKGAVNLTWSIPLTKEGAFFMVQGFHGYGDSLIDYNRSITRLGAGVMLCR